MFNYQSFVLILNTIMLILSICVYAYEIMNIIYVYYDFIRKIPRSNLE